jgi:hypothetical protein
MPDRAAPETEPEIEVTPEMIEAGLGELMQFSREGDVYEDRVRSIYEAMVRASPSGARTVAVARNPPLLGLGQQ